MFSKIKTAAKFVLALAVGVPLLVVSLPFAALVATVGHRPEAAGWWCEGASLLLRGKIV